MDIVGRCRYLSCKKIVVESLNWVCLMSNTVKKLYSVKVTHMPELINSH